MKIKFRNPRVFTFLLTLLLLGGVASETWAAYKVTYHILTLPIDNNVYHMNGSDGIFAGKRLEAVRVVDNNATKLGLPTEYQSPLAKNFRLYDASKVIKNAAVAMYTYDDGKNKSRYYSIEAGNVGDSLHWGNAVTANMDVYVTYEYDATKGVDLSGNTEYNLTMSGGFIAFNRGRNNRMAVFKKDLELVTAEDLASEDFVQYPYTNANLVPNTKVKSYWQDNNNKNTKDSVAGQFHFIFKFEGSDPYNILIGTAYNKNYTYVEKHGSENSYRYKWYKGSHLFRPNSDKNFFMSSDDHWEYTTVNSDYSSEEKPDIARTQRPGYFKSKGKDDLTYGTFALLNNSDKNGYVFMVSRFVNGEGDLSTTDDYNKAKYNYLTCDGDFNNLTYASKTLKEASKDYSTDQKIYQVHKFVYKVTKKISGGDPLAETMRVSEYDLEGNPTNFIPESLRRKYVTYKAYSNAGMTNEVTTFTNAADNCVDDPGDEYPGCKVIYLDYDDSEMPFKTWKKANPSDEPDYDEMTWYNIHANKNAAYILSWDGSKVVTRNVASGYPRATHFAFIGDPYDLKIVGRTASQDGETPSTLKYMTLNATLENNAGFNEQASATTWGIVYDDDTADNKDCFRLKDNSGDKYLHIKDASGDNYPLNGTAASADAVRITVDELPKMNYTYYIMRSDNSIAVWTSGGYHEPSAKLDYNHIPKEIRSPFLQDVALTFYGGTSDKATAISNATAKTPTITYAPNTDNGAIQHIVVRYDAFDSSAKKALINDATYNVRLNGQFIYYEDGVIKSSATLVENDDKFNWILGGGDPYAMTIKSGISGGKYIEIPEKSAGVIDWPVGDEAGSGTAISWSNGVPASKYIIKSSTEDKSYEVMGATGDGDYNAGYENYNFGRPADNTVKMYSSWKYLSGSNVLRFELIKNTARNVTYHLVDIKNNTVLLSVQTRQESDAAPSLPAEYRSPLVETYAYWGSLSDAQNKSGGPRTTVGASGDIYVTYTANDLVDMSGRTLYLMKFAQGDQFRQEDGSDGLLAPMSEFTGDDAAKKYKYQAVYPYCNGDCNFFVYGQEQYDLQQQGAASTRTRWAWYVESVKNDPYHVKIFSRQQETYPAGSGNDYNAYFRTYKPNGYSEVVTTLAWPGISGEQGTEYMVLGSTGQFRLVTSDAINDGSTTARRPVNSFEQYWKTWNTIRKIVLDDKDAVAKQSDPNTVPAEKNTPVAIEKDKDNRTYLTEEMGWHSYENWAYAIRWNDYNKDGDKNKKGWESIEHWYQTVNMGEGYFDFVKTTIDPVLILLDQHGWEVMRKPLPSSPDDPDKYAKYDAIRPYDSPMVKEYAFWKTAKKRTGFHQYYLLSDRIGGKDFTSTSLTDLPPYDSENVKDAKGNLLDQYVTYIVKDEYAQTYDPSNKTGQPFLIEQGSHFAYNNNNAETVGTQDVPTTGGMSQYIISNISNLTADGSKKNELWYVKPNTDIDIEMGYQDATKFPEGYAHNWDSKTPNAYEDSKYNALKAAVYVKETTEYKNASADDKKKLTDKYGEFSFSNGFDPYNIQISSVSNGEKFFVTNATKAEIDEGSILGDGTTNTLGGKAKVETALVGGMDNRTLQMTNATFMAVLDEDGHMQLMPRFDQEKRLKDFSALVHTDDAEETKTHTKLYRPLVYNYHIIDNSGNEALRYQGGGDLVPQTPAWFQSQLAKDYTYHTAKPCTNENLITESLEGASLTDNKVYVRYSYDETADFLKILQGKWLTMKVNNLDAQYTTVSVTTGIYSGTKPDPVEDKQWQWKFTENSQTDPDPYAVSLYNRNTAAGTATSVNEKTKFALLNWYDNNGVDPNAYTLAVHGLGTYSYDFVNGTSMNTETAATTATEGDVKSTSCTYTDGAKIVLNDDVSHSYTYKVYTNGGVFAVSADQDNNTASENDYIPVLPEEIKSPLLNMDQFRYYDKAHFTFGASQNIESTDTIGKALNNLYGIYDDIVIVRYTPYNLKKTEYKVPNVRNDKDTSPVARDESSNDAALDINNELLYNIIWYDNYMMSSNGTSISDGGAKELDGTTPYVWKFEGNDPYAIKIKHNNSNKYAVGTGALAETATSTFMLLPSTDTSWEYGMLQVTGDDNSNKLTGVGDNLTADAPTKFIIFGLSTHKVIYHLVIANIGNKVTIPYRETKGGTLTTKDIDGSTHRDLTTTTTVTGDTYQLGETKSINSNNVNYCVDEGHITLGDPLKVPEALERPNCKYFYYVEGVYTDGACTTPDETLNTQYKGLQITQMGTEPALLGKTVVINVEYQFDDKVPTNTGSHFVTNSNGTQWYTFETNDETPYLAHYTYKDAILTGVAGRIGHYTNDFLWSPVGDPYGFKMYNRYVYKNGGNTGYVMKTSDAPAADADLIINTDDSPIKTVYELLAGETDGCFKVQTLTIPSSGTPYYIDNSTGTLKLKTSTNTEWSFGLSDALLDPYYLGAGNVGGLTTTAKAGQDKSGKERYEEATNLIAKQEVVFNPVNIVDFTPGYYRIFNEPNSLGITVPRYLSGYTHKTELTSSIPMHFYEKKGVSTTFEALGSTGYTKTAATQGQLPISAPEYDPASIFYISGSGPTYTMQTQGLYVKENKMTSDSEDATSFYIMDIGGGVVALHNGAVDYNSRKYLNYDQSNANYIYDVKYSDNIGIADATKWCMEPANNMGLYIETHSGGEEETLTDLWYYSSYCVPFDLLIADKEGEDKDHSSNAYTCISTESPWPGTTEAARVGLHPKPIGKYNTGTYQNNDYFVPAGTPVLFSTKRATEYIKATIPTTTPSTSISTIFSAKYLEQTLPDWNDANRVYVFGPKMEGTLNINTSDGTVNAVLPSLGNTNVGFHLNANPNKEAGTTPASWTRNNYYVLHNRIYYKAGGSGASPAPTKRAPEFVPVIFDDDEEQQELNPDGTMEGVGDGCIYDLMGRKVATREQVEDGSWKQRVATGIYILNGKKFQKK